MWTVWKKRKGMLHLETKSGCWNTLIGQRNYQDLLCMYWSLSHFKSYKNGVNSCLFVKTLVIRCGKGVQNQKLMHQHPLPSAQNFFCWCQIMMLYISNLKNYFNKKWFYSLLMSTTDYKPMLFTFLQPKYNIWISRMAGCVIFLEALGMAAILFKEN